MDLSWLTVILISILIGSIIAGIVSYIIIEYQHNSWMKNPRLFDLWCKSQYGKAKTHESSEEKFIAMKVSTVWTDGDYLYLQYVE